MNLIYLVVAFILGLVTWICTQTTWQYAYILFYVFLFLCSWYINLFMLYQEENDKHKKYTLWTPANLIYVIIIAVLLFLLRDYHILELINKYTLSEFASKGYLFYKFVVILNMIQGIFLLLYFKIRSIYYNA
jgi:hypothetical protein